MIPRKKKSQKLHLKRNKYTQIIYMEALHREFFNILIDNMEKQIKEFAGL